MLIDVGEHDLLSEKSKALRNTDPNGFAAQVRVAEILLGIPDPVPTTGTVDLGIAVVLQLNFQIAQGIDPLFISASTSQHTRNSVQYRDRFIDPRALALVTAVAGLGGRFSGKMTSQRYSGLQ